MGGEHELSEALRHQAARVDGHRLGLDQVQARARGIQRRRAAVSLATGAAVVAVAAPLAASLTGEIGPDRGPRVAASPTGSAEPSETWGKADILTIDVDVASHPPAVPYLYAGKLHAPDGDSHSVPGEWNQVLSFGDGYALGSTSMQTLAVLDEHGNITDQRASSNSAVVTADRTLIAHMTPQGEVATLTADGTATTIRLSQPFQTPQIVAIGSDAAACDSRAPSNCIFLINDTGQDPAAYQLDAAGTAIPFHGYERLSSLGPQGQVSGVTEVDDLRARSCSEVRSNASPSTVLWSTCDYTIGPFSPDGQLVIGYPPYADGPGAGSIAILDATNGNVLASLALSRRRG